MSSFCFYGGFCWWLLRRIGSGGGGGRGVGWRRNMPCRCRGRRIFRGLSLLSLWSRLRWPMRGVIIFVRNFVWQVLRSMVNKRIYFLFVLLNCLVLIVLELFESLSDNINGSLGILSTSKNFVIKTSVWYSDPEEIFQSLLF